LKRQKFDTKGMCGHMCASAQLRYVRASLIITVAGFTSYREEVSIISSDLIAILYSKNIDIGPDILKLFKNVTGSVFDSNCRMNCSRYNAA